MNLFERIFRRSGDKRSLRKQADVWAAQHYPLPERGLAAAAARVVAEQRKVGLEQLSPTTRFYDDLLLGHLDCALLLIAIEGEFGLQIPDEHGDEIMTLGDLISYLHKRV